MLQKLIKTERAAWKAYLAHCQEQERTGGPCNSQEGLTKLYRDEWAKAADAERAYREKLAG